MADRRYMPNILGNMKNLRAMISSIISNSISNEIVEAINKEPLSWSLAYETLLINLYMCMLDLKEIELAIVNVNNIEPITVVYTQSNNLYNGYTNKLIHVFSKPNIIQFFYGSRDFTQNIYKSEEERNTRNKINTRGRLYKNVVKVNYS